MELEIQIAKNSKAMAEAQKIRKQVFVCEQGIPLELDLDGLDNEAFHALAYCNNKVIGTARLVLEEKQRAVLARVAVVPEYRGNGIATQLIKAIETKGRELNIKTIVTHPHEHLKSYYESKGYKIEKKGGMVGNHQLLKMSKDIDN